MIYYTERIKEIRQKKEISQKEMGKKLKMHQTQYGRYETGKNNLNTETFRKICIILNISADYLLGFTNEEKPLK